MLLISVLASQVLTYETYNITDGTKIVERLTFGVKKTVKISLDSAAISLFESDESRLYIAGATNQVVRMTFSSVARPSPTDPIIITDISSSSNI